MSANLTKISEMFQLFRRWQVIFEIILSTGRPQMFSISQRPVYPTDIMCLLIMWLLITQKSGYYIMLCQACENIRGLSITRKAGFDLILCDTFKIFISCGRPRGLPCLHTLQKISDLFQVFRRRQVIFEIIISISQTPEYPTDGKCLPIIQKFGYNFWNFFYSWGNYSESSILSYRT